MSTPPDPATVTLPKSMQAELGKFLQQPRKPLALPQWMKDYPTSMPPMELKYHPRPSLVFKAFHEADITEGLIRQALRNGMFKILQILPWGLAAVTAELTDEQKAALAMFAGAPTTNEEPTENPGVIKFSYRCAIHYDALQDAWCVAWESPSNSITLAHVHRPPHPAPEPKAP